MSFCTQKKGTSVVIMIYLSFRHFSRVQSFVHIGEKKRNPSIFVVVVVLNNVLCCRLRSMRIRVSLLSLFLLVSNVSFNLISSRYKYIIHLVFIIYSFSFREYVYSRIYIVHVYVTFAILHYTKAATAAVRLVSAKQFQNFQNVCTSVLRARLHAIATKTTK